MKYTSSWCGPCKALEPRLENIIAQRKGEIQLAKVNIDDMGEIAAKYEVKLITKYFVTYLLCNRLYFPKYISSLKNNCQYFFQVSTIPALVVFENGKVKERLVGLQDEDKLNLWIDKILKK